MKSKLKWLLVALLLPAIGFGQAFKTPDFSPNADFISLAKSIEKHSPFIQKLLAGSAIRTDMQPEEARALINEKLHELNNDDLKKTYAKLDGEQATRIGIILYLMMNGLSNTEESDYVDYKLAFGGGLGVYLMWTLANFILMPELAFMIRPLSQDYDGDKIKERYTYLTLAFTAMYMIRAQAITFLLGLSPNFGYALGGKVKFDDDDWEDIDFDDGVKRTNIGLGITAGIMLRNAIIIRLMYNLGLTKLYEGSDMKMYAIMLAVSVPLWTLK